MEQDQTIDFKRGRGSILLIACGALGREIVQLIEANSWQHLDVACLPAKLHHRPALIPEAVRDKIRENKGQYKEIYVLYGDCGTGGRLDQVLEAEGGIERIPGPHCFSFYIGNSRFESESDANIATFYLTDFFCRHFEKFVWQAIGLDRHPGMPDLVFGNYRKLVYQPQTDDPALEEKAREIAKRLKLSFEIHEPHYGDLQLFLAEQTGEA